MTTLTILNYTEIAAVSGGSTPPIEKLQLTVVLPHNAARHRGPVRDLLRFVPF